MHKFCFTMIGTLALATAASAADLSIYTQGSALVSQQRSVALDAGVQTLAWPGLAQRILPQTLWLQGEDVQLVGSSYSDEPVDRASLLRPFVGQTVTLLRSDGSGGDVSRQAALVSVGSTPVVRLDGHIEMLGARSPWRIAVTPSPDTNLLPAGLTLRVDVGSAGRHDLQLIYQTAGLRWKAEYVGRYDDQAKTLSLVARASITNQSGTDFDHADVSLIAGVVNRDNRVRPMMMRAASVKAASPVPAQRAFAYYRYDLPGELTLADGATRNRTLFRSIAIDVQRSYVIAGGWRGGNGGASTHAAIRLAFTNDQGLPMPAGTLRVYGSGSHPLLLGEDSIGNIPEGGDVHITLGRAFDITAQRTVANQDRRGSTHASDRHIVVSNAKDVAVKVKVIEALPGDWQITAQSSPSTRRDARHAVWIVAVPAHGSTTLEYTVQWH